MAKIYSLDECESNEPGKKWYSWFTEASATRKAIILACVCILILTVIILIIYPPKQGGPGSSSTTTETSVGSGPSVAETPIDAFEVFSAYYNSDLKGDEKFGNGVYVIFNKPTNVERRLADGRYFIAVDREKDNDLVRKADWIGYGVICSASQVKLVKTTGLKVKVKKVNRTAPYYGHEGVFVIMEAMER